MARVGGNKKRFQYCQEILYLRALQGHSGRNLIDPSLQDNVLIPDGFFKYICHVGCEISIQDWYQEVKIWANARQYSFCLWILWIRNTRILRQPTWDNQTVRPHRSTRWTLISVYLDCHMQFWNKPTILVFVSSWRRSRTILIDKLFNPIYNRIMPATHLVNSQRRWLRTWAM